MCDRGPVQLLTKGMGRNTDIRPDRNYNVLKI